MKLRNLLIFIFLLVVLVPSLLFWAWPYSKALDSEIYEVKERHLVIAKKLAMALERYYQDVTNAFTLLSYNLGEDKNDDEVNTLLDVYDFQAVLLVSRTDGHIIDCIERKGVSCDAIIQSTIQDILSTASYGEKTSISPVQRNKNFDNNSMLVVTRQVGDNVALGYLSTNYIVELGKRVAFGKKGHAAIVDQNGSVMAHPVSEWVKVQKSMATTSVVQYMMAGKTGVATFISPAFFNEIIAGYAAVPNAGWGVMVPQPLLELHKKAEAIDRTALLVMMLGLGIALLIALPVSFMITKPLERLSRLTRIIGRKDDYDTDMDITESRILPLEVRELNEHFIDMMNQLKANRKSIARLAYMDINTGLPNRNYFQKLARQAISEMKKNHTNGAVLFIDFDGFKQVNDTYGHRTMLLT